MVKKCIYCNVNAKQGQKWYEIHRHCFERFDDLAAIGKELLGFIKLHDEQKISDKDFVEGLKVIVHGFEKFDERWSNSTKELERKVNGK